MPKQKDLKRLIRSRMKKTGEAYTAARLQFLKKSESTSNYAQVAGMSDASVRKQTGRTWAQWVRALDAARASTRLVVSDGDCRIRAHSRSARPGTAPGRRV